VTGSNQVLLARRSARVPCRRFGGHLLKTNWLCVIQTRRAPFASLLVIFLTATAQGQRELKDLPSPDPAVELASFKVPEGVEVTLWAAEPFLFKPIQMNFDDHGRLWVACSKTYPQIKPGEIADDQILVLEDKDGDGKADTSSVFAEGLLIPTGVIPGDGGAYVANSTELLHLADTDNDGKADKRRIMLSGFGAEDTHHILHTLRWGYDGALYFDQSVYIHAHVETPFGPRQLGGAGIWQFRPESKKLEVFVRGFVNPWGHHYDETGNGFATDGAGFEGIGFLIPGASYTAIGNPERYLHGLNPGSPKYCGLEVLSGRHVPDDLRGSLVTNDFRANRVVRFEVSDDGSGFAAREQEPLIQSTHIAFRPIDVKMGPDGAIYIADWYNPIIQHGEVDFRDERRDHARGRIWRIGFKDRPKVAPPALAGASIETLLDALLSPEGFTREQARRLLKERGAVEVEPALIKWTAKAKSDRQRLEALWIRQGIDRPDEALLSSLLDSSDPKVRRAAARTASSWQSTFPAVTAKLTDRVLDENARVRLEAVRALATIAAPSAGPAALRALEKPLDVDLDYALWLTSRETAPNWLSKAILGQLIFSSDRELAFALLAVGTEETVAPLMDLYRAGRIAKEDEPKLLSTLGQLGGPTELGRIFDLVLGESLPIPQRAALLDALSDAQRRRQTRPDGDLRRIGPILADSKADPRLRAAAARAAGAWRIDDLRSVLREALAADETADQSSRKAAMEALAALGDVESLLKLSAKDRSHQTSALAIAALAAIDLPAASAIAAEWLARSDANASGEAEGLVAALVGRKDGPAALTAAIAGRVIAPDVARRASRAARSAGADGASLADALAKAGGLGADAGWSKLPPEQVIALAAEVNQGDPERGEAIFRRSELNCLKCHAIAGSGSPVGPGLESIGASAPIDYLVDSLLAPDKAIKEGYHSVVLALADGQVLTGRIIGENDQEITLTTADLRQLFVPKADVEERKQGGSLMPAGLIDVLTRAELLDLLAFLSAMGKPGAYAVGTDRVFRTWRALEGSAALGDRIRRKGLDALAAPSDDLPTTSIYTNVSGNLPLGELPTIRAYNDAPLQSVVKTSLDVTTPGVVRLRLNSPRGVSVWVDDVPTAAAESIDVDFPIGVHTLTLVLDRSLFEGDLRVTLEDAPGSSAQARPLLGP
jgi:putative heme-binding domain-containing protein